MAPNQNQFVDPSGHPRTADRVMPVKGGFLLYGAGSQSNPWDEGHAQVNHVWFRDTLSNSLQMAWNDVVAAKCTREALADSASPGATIFVPMTLAPGDAKTIKVHIAWHVPRSNVFAPYWPGVESGPFSFPKGTGTYRPWYSGRFQNIHDLVGYWTKDYQDLNDSSSTFSRALYDSTLPPEVLEAVAANLIVLKAPNVLRQLDGRIWGWEGCGESEGIGGYGTPPHVYGVGQAMPHLFADLERGARETGFGADQDNEGRQSDRAALPIRPLRRKELAIYDAVYPFMGVVLFYRDWRISGDTAWLKKWWPSIRSALEYLRNPAMTDT
jgi:beta-glucosidase 2, glycosyl-hydrolase family 116 N-term